MMIQDIPNARNGTFIDVRSQEEFEWGHTDGAVNIPWGLHLYYLDEFQALPRPWMLCCEEGIRSEWVAQSLQNLGFEEVYNVGRWYDIRLEKKILIPEAA